MAPRFGCAICFPESAEDAWRGRQGLARGPEIADESHFHMTLLSCPACGQAFASVFCETVDWIGGEDPQDWLLIPVTAREADGLARAGEAGVEAALRSLDPGRRHLQRSFPSDAERPSVGWLEGPIRPPRHD